MKNFKSWSCLLPPMTQHSSHPPLFLFGSFWPSFGLVCPPPWPNTWLFLPSCFFLVALDHLLHLFCFFGSSCRLFGPHDDLLHLFVLQLLEWDLPQQLFYLAFSFTHKVVMAQKSQIAAKQTGMMMSNAFWYFEHTVVITFMNVEHCPWHVYHQWYHPWFFPPFCVWTPHLFQIGNCQNF